MPNPVQVILNAQNFADAPRDAGSGGEHKDFFFNEPVTFQEHKRQLATQVRDIGSAIKSSDLGYVKVKLKRSALAKSHRPFQAILTPKTATVVGGLDLGEVLVEVTTSGLKEIEKRIEGAPADSPTKERNGKTFPNPARSKAEVGAIEKFELYGPSDKRNFTVQEALEKFADPRRAGAYFVELFEMPPAPDDWELCPSRKRRLFESLIAGFIQLGPGTVVDRLDLTNYVTNFLLVRLLQSETAPVVYFDPNHDHGSFTPSTAPFDNNVMRQSSLLRFLDEHPLVKRIQIAPIPYRSRSGMARVRPTAATLPAKNADATYPLVGIIDGGIGASLSSWVVGKRGTLAPEHQDAEHGTFIGGLLVAGSSLNGADVCPEADGCDLYDIDVMPNDDMPRVFQQYYLTGFQHFFEEVEQAIDQAKREHGVRVFNFSLNDDELASTAAVSFAAQRLDVIAQELDVIIVISAGNLDGEARAEWPDSPVEALRLLAGHLGDERLATPAESSRNVTVGSVNPPGLSNALADAPANYSRRGPGLNLSVKPDYAHFGGSGTRCPQLGSGLFSVAPDGSVVENRGTSFATPLIAKTLATLIHQIEGHTPRETVVALVTHSARVRAPLVNKLFKGIARHFVGFGRPASVSEMLSTPDSAITLIFHGKLMPGKNLDFAFTWPSSLVEVGGKCHGHATMTLVYTPPLNYSFGAESVRVNLDAALQQDIGDGHWSARTRETFWDKEDLGPAHERELIEAGLKWAPVKTYGTARMTGKGSSSSWRIFLEYITRANTVYPDAGIPFSIVLTIEDSKNGGPIFNEVRQALQVAGADLAAIRTATRVPVRF
ncbi:MAG: S8 family peptidase [Candidatus Cybelea sp.]